MRKRANQVAEIEVIKSSYPVCLINSEGKERDPVLFCFLVM
jgi:hypothetical protein